VEDLLCGPPRRRLPEKEEDPAATLVAALETRKRFVNMVHSILEEKEEDERTRQNGGSIWKKKNKI